MSMPFRQVVVLSGKGGTGKTTMTAGFACYAGKQVIADCDVDASNLSLLLQGEVRSSTPFIGGLKAWIDPDRCSRCGKCEEHCRFSAIKDLKVDSMACEGCGVCHIVCPSGAVELSEAVSGDIFVRDTPYGTVVDADMLPGEPNSGKLAARVRAVAREEAMLQGASLVLVDGPPGTGCPVISSITGTDLAIIVTEPTVSGGHDLSRVVDLADHFGIPCAIIINKHDLNPAQIEDIERECARREITIVGRLPFDVLVGEVIINGQPLPVYAPGSPAEIALRDTWENIMALLDRTPPGGLVRLKGL